MSSAERVADSISVRVGPEVLRHRSGVNDVPRGQPAARRHDRLSRLIGPCAIAALLDLLAAARLDRARHAAPHPQRVVRGVDDRLHLTRGDVAFDDFDGQRGESVEGPHVGTGDAYRSRDST